MYQLISLLFKTRSASPPIDAVVASGVIPRLVEFLSVDNPKLQLQATWAITNGECPTLDNSIHLISQWQVAPSTHILLWTLTLCPY